MQCDLHFPTPIWRQQLKINNDRILNLCKKIYDMDDNGRKFSNRGGWQSHDIFYREHEELSELETVVIHHSNRILKDQIGYPDHLNFNIGNFWINKNWKNNYNDMHVHPQSALAGCYYVKCNEKNGDIVFPRNPTEGYILGAVQSFGGMPKELIKDSARYTPKQGMLILFMGHVPHYVEPNTVDEERISIAFNILFPQK